MSELWRKSAGELAALIRDREAVNPHLNVIVRLLPDEALAAAERRER